MGQSIINVDLIFQFSGPIFDRFKKVDYTLESRIDVGQGINIGLGRFAKKNKCRALNKRRA